MGSLSGELDRYLTVRRSLGYDLGTTARVLRKFVAFAEQQSADRVSTDLFLQWQGTFGHAGRQTWAARLGMVRLFAQWLNGLDAVNEVPPLGLIPARYLRSRPYIYSDEEIRSIVAAAGELASTNGLRALSYSTLFGLIAVTGLRISEAIALDDGDVDFETGALTIRRGKLGKSRMVPVESSTLAHLTAYVRERDRLLGFKPQSFFITERGTRPDDCSARYNFAAVCQQIGLRTQQRYQRHGRGPRIHDLRHTFAARTMVSWYRAGKDPAHEMIKLSTYLGHSNPAHTYWYIEAVPELLELAAQRVPVASTEEA